MPLCHHYAPVLPLCPCAVLSEVVVGFENESITIPEGQGSVELCASIISPDPDELPDSAIVIANVYLESDTATSKAGRESMEWWGGVGVGWGEGGVSRRGRERGGGVLLSSCLWCASPLLLLPPSPTTQCQRTSLGQVRLSPNSLFSASLIQRCASRP